MRRLLFFSFPIAVAVFIGGPGQEVLLPRLLVCLFVCLSVLMYKSFFFFSFACVERCL